MYSQQRLSILKRGKTSLWQGFAMSHVGTTRELNEDAFFIDSAIIEDQNYVFAVVCDGLGGLEKGELASSWLMTALSDYWYKSIRAMTLLHMTKEDLYQGLKAELLFVHQKMRKHSLQNNLQMGTTCTAIILCNNALYGLHVGDSRAYLNKNRFYPITRDDTWVQDQVDSGIITYAESMTHPSRHVLTQCVGGQSELEIHEFSESLKHVTLVLLCTDGVYNACDISVFDACWQPERAGKAGLELLFMSLLEEEADDNLTAVIIKKNKQPFWPFRG